MKEGNDAMSTFQELEEQLHNKLSNCEIIADMKLTNNDLVRLRVGIKDAIKGSAFGFLNLMRKYPLCCLAHMVFFRIYSETDEFWTPWSSSINIELDNKHQGSIGRCFRDMLDKLNLKYDNDGQINIAALDCQAGVQDRNMAGIFHLLEGADFFELNSLAYEITGPKSYMVHKSVERYAKNYKGSMIGFLATALDVMQSDTNIDNVPGTYDNRLYKGFLEWKDEINTSNRRAKRASQIERIRPEITLNPDGFGLCIKFPSLARFNEFAEYLIWKVDGFEMRADYKSRHDGEVVSDKLLTPVLPKSNYDIELFDDIDFKAYTAYVIPGVKNLEYTLFNQNGKQLDSDVLPDEGFLLTLRGNIDIKFNGLYYYEVELPSEQRINAMRAWYFTISEENASIFIGDTFILPRKKVDIRLTCDSFLFGEKPNGANVPIYTEFPNIICMNRGENLTLTLSCTESGFRKSFGLNDYIKIADSLYKRYGSYLLRIDINGVYYDTLQFVYLPYINYQEKNLRLWPDEYGLQYSGFSYQESDIVEVNSEIQAINADGWKQLGTNLALQRINGSLSIPINRQNRKFIWSKTIRNIVWSVYDVTELQEAQFDRSSVTKHSLTNTWLRLSVIRDQIISGLSLRLLDKEKNTLQELDITPGSNGIRSVSLAIFSDTAEVAAKPAELVLQFIDNFGREQTIIVVRLFGKVYLPDLKYSYNKENERAILAWNNKEAIILNEQCQIVGITNSDISIPVSLARPRKLIAYNRCGIQITTPLSRGVYIIAPLAKDDDYFDVKVFEPPDIYQGGLLTVGYDKNMQLVEIFEHQLNSFAEVFDERICKFIYTLVANFSETNDPICEMISRFCNDNLSETQRGMILYWLSNYNVPAKIAEKLTHILKLFLFKIPVDLVLSSNQSHYLEALSDFDTTIYQLWSMRSGVMQKEKINQIGKNAQEDFGDFYDGFETARMAEIDALEHSNSSRALHQKSVVPANHGYIFKEFLQGLYSKLDQKENSLPLILRMRLESRKLNTENWKHSISAIFYYSALCGAIESQGADNADVRRFYDIMEKEYPNLYGVVKRDILIAEAICKGA